MTGKSPGTRLRTWRAAEGISQQELGDRLNVSGARISQLEADLDAPGLELAVRIEALTGIAASSWITYRAVAS